MNGLIFDIKEFSIRDGEGIRTTVFFKGCPLRCAWCHNPEGLSPTPELWADPARCRDCGLCRKPCEHEDCQPFGRCLHICPQDLVRCVGKTYTSQELAARLRRQKPMFDAMGGGVTLSGGEPLLQADFCAELLEKLDGDIHTTIETSGYAPQSDFERIIHLCDFVIMDIKLMDDEAHCRWTGVSNAQIQPVYIILIMESSSRNAGTCKAYRLNNDLWGQNSGTAHLYDYVKDLALFLLGRILVCHSPSWCFGCCS